MREIPTQKQLDFLDWEFGAFFHFGIRTFYPERADWDCAIMSADKFNPYQLDCEQWIKTIKDAGAKYAVLVAKHHDGFANWPSKYTNYSVAHTPWRDGQGDVVREFTDACRKYGIKVGIYYSPAEFEMRDGLEYSPSGESVSQSKRTPQEYDDYFINQIGELLSNYGVIDYLWFDGCGSETHKYDEKRLINAIRTMQPNIMIFNMWDPDTRWIGNEAGVATYPCMNTVDTLEYSVLQSEKQGIGNRAFLPAECDCRLRLDNWFYSPYDEDTIKSVDELMGLYYYSVGRGANLLLNVAPDVRGLIHEADASRLLEFGAEVKQRFANPIPNKSQILKPDNKLIITIDTPTVINHLIIKENLIQGECVKKFKISIQPHYWGDPIVVFEGHNIGHKAICQFPTVYTREIILEIIDLDGEFTIDDVQVFYVK